MMCLRPRPIHMSRRPPTPINFLVWWRGVFDPRLFQHFLQQAMNDLIVATSLSIASICHKLRAVFVRENQQYQQNLFHVQG